MSEAFKCDTCGGLFEGPRQSFGLKYEDECNYLGSLWVKIGEDRDLCPKCVIWALKEALKVAGG